MKAVLPVEVIVLAAVDDVEAGGPQAVGRAEQQRRQGKPPRHSEPRADRRDAAGRAQKEVAEPGEPLGIGVEGHHQEGEGGEDQAEGVQHRGAHDEQREAGG